MNHVFNLKVSFKSAYSIPESVNKLVNAVKNQQDSFKLEKESESNLLLLIGTCSMIYYNSFTPVVKIYLQNMEDRTIIFLSFGLKKSEKIWGVILSAFLLLAECNIFIPFSRGNLAANGLLFRPIGLWFWGVLLYRIALYVSSRRILEWLSSAINGA